jgi:hypothetical protein
MATLSCAPLKNSGFRSIAMSCVELLEYFGDAAGHEADETKTAKYSRVASRSKKRRRGEFPKYRTADRG